MKFGALKTQKMNFLSSGTAGKPTEVLKLSKVAREYRNFF
jgi:hypothetical protein